MIKYIYALFLGLLLATFIGVGIATFYPGPTPPDYQAVEKRITGEPTAVELAAQDELNRQQEEFQDKLSLYNRNVSMLSLVAALIILIVALTAATRLTIIADGLLLGGVFTLLYSIGLGLAAESQAYRFAIITVGLAVALVIGYRKFARPDGATN